MLEVNLEAGSLQLLLRDQRQFGNGSQIGGAHQGHRRAVIAGFLQHLFGLGRIGNACEIACVFIGIHCAAREHASAQTTQLGHAHLGIDISLLAHGHHGSLPDFGIVKGGMQVVKAHDELQTCRREVFNTHAFGFLQGVHLLKARLLNDVDFASFECIELRLSVTNNDPLDAVKINGAATRHGTGRLRA